MSRIRGVHLFHIFKVEVSSRVLCDSVLSSFFVPNKVCCTIPCHPVHRHIISYWYRTSMVYRSISILMYCIKLCTDIGMESSMANLDLKHYSLNCSWLLKFSQASGKRLLLWWSIGALPWCKVSRSLATDSGTPNGDLKLALMTCFNGDQSLSMLALH